jgi:Ca2+-binding RTX toxin-like protein
MYARLTSHAMLKLQDVRRQSRARLETLEPRRLLSVTLNAGTLRLTGTNHPDDISLTRSGVDDIVAQVNDEVRVFDMDNLDEVFIFGQGEHDFIIARAAGLTAAGIDIQINGGDGDDQIECSNNNDTVFGGPGNDTIAASSGHDRLFGGDGDDDIFAGSGNDALVGDAGNDSLVGAANDDTFEGGAGNDTLIGSDGRDTADYSSRTADLFIFQNPPYLVYGRAGEIGGEENDVLAVDIERVLGGSGNDLFRSGGGASTYFGGDGNDSLSGGGGADALFGGGGDDEIVGGDGNDFLDGGDGNDSLYGQRGNDTLLGQGGNDRLFARDDARDTVNGGSNSDIGTVDSLDLVTSVETRA